LVTVNGGSVVSLMRACVESYVIQGISFDEAATECSSMSFPAVPETGIDGAMLAGPGNTADLNIPVCGGSSVDPLLASPVAPAARAARVIADSLNSSQMSAENALKDGDPLGLVGVLEFAPIALITEVVAVALDALDKVLDVLSSHEATNDHNQVSKDTVSACEEAAAFIGACNAEDWKSGPCDLFRKKLDGCADPLIASVDPEGESTCRMTSVDDGAVEKIVLIVCAQDARVAPDQNPCQPIDGVVTRRSYRLPGDPERPLCSDPRALVDAGDCINEINILEFGDDIHDVVREAQTRLGGPVFVVPMPAPFACGLRPCD
jgi:hypothetical protein